MAKKKTEENDDALGMRVTLAPIGGYLSTGCTLLDLAIADRLPGGFPGGRISHVYGLESTAKTVLVSEPLGAAQRAGGKAIFLDAESTCDFSRLGLFGVDCGKDPLRATKSWEYDVPVTIEDLFDHHIQKAIKDVDPNKLNAMGIDSLTALPSVVESKGKLTDASYGTSRAKQLSAAFRKYLAPLATANLAMIFVDQSRDNIGQQFGPSEVVSGGKALKFYSSVRIHLARKAQVKNAAGIVIGMEYGFNTVKNKVAAPYRQGSFFLLFDYGVDDIWTSIQWLKDCGDTGRATLECNDCGHQVEVAKATRSKDKNCPQCGGSMRKLRSGGGYEFLGVHFQSMSSAIKWVEENEKEEELRELVAETWVARYAVEPRNPKKRY